MRKMREPTARHLLRKPLVLGVPFEGLLALSAVTMGIFILGGGGPVANAWSVGIGLAGYGGLRVFSRFAKPGWEELPLFWLEGKRELLGEASVRIDPSSLRSYSPDTFTDERLIEEKEALAEVLAQLKPGASRVFCFEKSEDGLVVSEIQTQGVQGVMRSIPSDYEGFEVYSLFQLPTHTDPLWSSHLLEQLPLGTQVITRVQGCDQKQIKKRLEHARRSNSQFGKSLKDIDSAISFEECSLVLEGLSRGEERIIEMGLVVLVPKSQANQAQDVLDESLFLTEKKPELPLISILGGRKRFHRSHWVRLATASDLMPSFCDPKEQGCSILRTVRGAPLYFSPQDSRLEALHWLVVGTTGSGKSFFTGLVLQRLIKQGSEMSVVFIDHNRSFRRLVKSGGGPYFEPSNLEELHLSPLFPVWDRVGGVSGVELSDLSMSDKKKAIHLILSQIEQYLRNRETTHPFYMVLDECWALMRDEPLLVQRAFREFRKLNGAVIAITQSLSDFLTDESGQSIFQNASVRILLRQGEDISKYQGVLGLNPVETQKVARLRQVKGVYSECLIKTPFISLLGRLYPTEAEHALLRTDNLRAELIREAKAKRQGGSPCVSV